MKLLTLGNPKTLKGSKKGYLTGVLHLAPTSLSGFNVCPAATPGCAAACLNTAGRGGIGLDENGLNTIQRARIARTQRLMGRGTRLGFMNDLAADIARLVAQAYRDGLIPAVRLNGTSDLRWERMSYLAFGSLMEAFPTVQFYDYTKLTNRRDLPANYHLTFSLADGNYPAALDALDGGMSVAAVVRDPKNPGKRKLTYPEFWDGHPTVDGDESDLRFLDPPASWVFLRAKGRAVKDTTGFVLDIPGIAS